MVLKKVLRVVVGLIGLLLLIFAIVSIIGPRSIYTNEVTINAPVEKVWEVVHDIEQAGQWMKGLKKVDTIKEVPGMVGNVYKMTFQTDNKNVVEIMETFTEFTENKSFAFDMDADGLDIKYKMELAPTDSNKTIVKSTSDAGGKGFFFRGMMPMMKSMMQSEDLSTLEHLKSVVEGS